MGLEQVGQVLMHDVAACGAEYVADKQNLHCTSLYGEPSYELQWTKAGLRARAWMKKEGKAMLFSEANIPGML